MKNFTAKSSNIYINIYIHTNDLRDNYSINLQKKLLENYIVSDEQRRNSFTIQAQIKSFKDNWQDYKVHLTSRNTGSDLTIITIYKKKTLNRYTHKCCHNKITEN